MIFLGEKKQEGIFLVDLWDRNGIWGYDMIFFEGMSLPTYVDMIPFYLDCRKPHVYPGVMRQKHGCSLKPIH